MEFPYILVTDFPQHQRRQRPLPWVRFGIYNPKNPDFVVYPIGLIDSGSDLTFINHEFGEQLDYDIKKGDRQEIKGVGGGSMQIYLHNVGFILEENGEKYQYTDLMGFTYSDFPSSMPQQTAILGTIGFFRHLKVEFNFPSSIKIGSLS